MGTSHILDNATGREVCHDNSGSSPEHYRRGERECQILPQWSAALVYERQSVHIRIDSKPDIRTLAVHEVGELGRDSRPSVRDRAGSARPFPC